MTVSKIVALSCAVAALTGSASAAVTQWNFNSSPADASTSTGSLIASTGFGTVAYQSAGTPQAPVFGSGSVDGGSTDPVTTDDTALNVAPFPAQGTENRTRGVGFSVSTVGMSNIVVSFDVRMSNSASAYMRFQYNLGDGNGWQDSTLFFFTMGGTGTGGRWFNNNSVDLSTIPGANENANFSFRMVSEFAPSTSTYVPANAPTSPYATSGSWRFDMVTIVPTPGAMALLGLGGLVTARRRR